MSPKRSVFFRTWNNAQKGEKMLHRDFLASPMLHCDAFSAMSTMVTETWNSRASDFFSLKKAVSNREFTSLPKMVGLKNSSTLFLLFVTFTFAFSQNDEKSTERQKSKTYLKLINFLLKRKLKFFRAIFFIFCGHFSQWVSLLEFFQWQERIKVSKNTFQSM